MLRLDRQRLAEADMPFRTEMQTRFDDVDQQGHINNAAVAVLLQDYAGELLFPDPVEIGIGVLEIGRSSFVLGNVARQRGRIATFAEVALIFTDRTGPVPLPDDARAELERGRIVQD